MVNLNIVFAAMVEVSVVVFATLPCDVSLESGQVAGQGVFLLRLL
jgi:hypothetical protein